MKKAKRTTHGLRDILFDELEELRAGDGDPTKAMAVANLAKQIIGVAHLEMRFMETTLRNMKEGIPVEIGNMQLGTAESADDNPRGS